MSSHQLIEDAARQIVTLIKAKCGGKLEATVAAVRKLCRHDFGVPARPINAPDDFYGMVRGDLGGDDCVIVYNSNLPEPDQIRVVIHELAEFLAARDVPELWAAVNESAQSDVASSIEPTELRHLVAAEVEQLLANEMGLDKPRSTWSVADILRVIPLAAKYVQPREEIEHLPYED
jgi:hypothetical protein